MRSLGVEEERAALFQHIDMQVQLYSNENFIKIMQSNEENVIIKLAKLVKKAQEIRKTSRDADET